MYPRVSQGSLHIPVTQNPLHTKNGHARIEQHRSAGVAKLMRSDVKSVSPAHRPQAG